MGGIFADVFGAMNGNGGGGYSKVIRGPGGMTFMYSSGGMGMPRRRQPNRE